MWKTTDVPREAARVDFSFWGEKKGKKWSRGQWGKSVYTSFPVHHLKWNWLHSGTHPIIKPTGGSSNIQFPCSLHIINEREKDSFAVCGISLFCWQNHTSRFWDVLEAWFNPSCLDFHTAISLTSVSVRMQFGLFWYISQFIKNNPS